MANYKTPGVYVEEITTLGSSVASVPTAIPGFTGYTEKALLPDGTSATLKPVRITSMLEYQQYFGGPFKEQYSVVLTGTAAATNIKVSTVSITPANTLSKFILFYQLQMFFANGGGTCYVVSVGNYSNSGVFTSPTTTPTTSLGLGIDKLEQIDEVTLLVTPECVWLDNGDKATVNNKMLTQCSKLQDRFSILDVLRVPSNTILQDAAAFRNSNVGADNLKYASSYYPALNTPNTYFYSNNEVIITDSRSVPVYNTAPNNTLATIYTGVCSFREILVGAGVFTVSDTFQITTPVGGSSITLTPNTSYPAGTTVGEGIANLIAAINSHPVLSLYVEARATATPTASFLIIAKVSGASGNYAISPSAGKFTYSPTTPTTLLNGGVNSSADISLFNSVKAELDKYTLTLYPSASMAGVYARVDNERGVWKAPANVGLALVNEPSVMITDQEQENLNVDSVSGKSINAIRQFTGRGNLVWGARTLAGNDNEWRYINVRRLFIYVEESIKKATEFVVFEPNTANTWQRVKGMSEAFLTSLWRDGALAGATTKEAFFVRVGLGVTMTADDILNGKMIVEIGMAASRPAEFIILRFSHKLQES